ncbi:sodium-coupled monocarboxylate transporter 1 [Lingula anatina]|uniref:Sodium-coupled monocarboxylate transporter 1 n=1 Tax=Lingula anatina TaxID=7574 RepID=A0A1S3IQV1_LINAN|nr:sodium-coupled monocarboxylate transporter 1 [Lingula anatina]|eukprot:XP_013400296.1 sodium-coupled monocarboxylate transporter 1 [Lingula anatina]
MVTAMLAILIKGYITIGGMSPAWDAMAAGDRLNFFVFDPSPATRHSFWTMLIGTTFLSIGFSCFNQASVQRIGSVKTDKDAVKAVLMNAPFLLVLTVPAALCGIAVYTHYTLLRCDPLKMKYVKNENELLAYYVMDVLQDLPGVPGLFIAALMSGALSSNSSSLNGIAAILWEDFLKYRYGKISDWKAALIAKITVIVFGGIGTLVAFMVTLIGGTIFQIALGFDGATNGPLFGLFFLGILCPFANWQGALTGGATSVAILLWLNIGSQLTSSTSYNPILPSVPSDRCEINATVNETWTYGVTTVWNAQSNVTTLGAVMSGTGSQSYSGLNGFYATSYLYYSPLGILTTVLVGAAVSAIINRYTRRQPYFDKNLVLRPLRRFVPSKTKYAYELEATPPTEESCQSALTDS